MKNLWLALSIALCLSFGLLSCTVEENESASKTETPVYVDSFKDLEIVMGQVVFVPAYTEIYINQNHTIPMTATVGIHNTDTEKPIIITSVRVYDTQGTFVKDFIEKPLRLAPIASKVLVSEGTTKGGGIGANFIVEWVAETPVKEPVIEAVMISRLGTSGFSLTSPGRIISQTK